MRRPPLPHPRAIGVTLIAAVLLAGCAAPRPPATPAPHAFISHTPPPAGDRSLRLAVKDLIDMKGEVTSAGSEYLYRTSPAAKADAACLRPARRSGVRIVGKANLSEFAIGVTGSNDYFGTPINPLDPTRVPGGSSSGSAVAVALGLADVALGTDTAGSIRVPAACCGVAGLKTTFGRISIEGVYPISPKYLDTVGPMARDVAGLVTGMDLLEPGFRAEYARVRAAHPRASGIRIGRLRVPGTNRRVDAAIDARLAAAGFVVVPMSAEFTREWRRAQADGNRVAAASAFVTNDLLRREREVSRRSRLSILFGDLVFSRRFSSEEKRNAAIARRDAWREDLRREFQQVDAIALPVLSSTPLRQRDILTALFEGKFLQTQYTVAVNYAGVPALALPVPLEGADFPVTSLQLIGPMNGEAELLNIGRLVEAASNTPGGGAVAAAR